MTASAFTGAAAVERPWEKRDDRARAHAPAEPKGAEDAPVDPASRGHSPSPPRNAFGHSKKAHEGGNGKSRAGGNGKSQADKTSQPRDARPSKDVPEQSHAGGNGKSQGAAHSSSLHKVDDGTKAKSQPGKSEEVPEPAAPAKPPEPVKSKDEAPAPEPVGEPVVEEPLPAAPDAPSPETGKGKGKAK
jgi:hypothetical protein